MKATTNLMIINDILMISEKNSSGQMILVDYPILGNLDIMRVILELLSLKNDLQFTKKIKYLQQLYKEPNTNKLVKKVSLIYLLFLTG